MSELEAVLRAKDTALGSDGIRYKMLRKLPKEARQFILKMFNIFFQEGHFLDDWRSATVLFFRSQKKTIATPVNYQPIA